MVEVVITHPGERVVEEFQALVARPTSPSSAPPPAIGLVEISQSQPTQLIPGPVGPQGPPGADSTVPGPVGPQGPQGSPDTAAQVLAKLVTVDGTGSNLDADLLDGQSGSYYTTMANQTGTISSAQHGNLPGGALHAAATAAAAGFMTDAPSDGVSYGRKNAAWATIVGGAVISDTAPPGPLQAGQLWWKSDTGNTYIWYNDGDSQQWVQQNVPPADAAIAVTNIVVTMVTTSGTYTKPANLKFLEVTCVGGGGGGSGANATTAGQSSAGGGGGGGGTAVKLYKAADLAASEVYTVGAKGGAPGGSGTAGGASSFSGLSGGGGAAAAAMGTTGSAAGTTPSPGVSGVGGVATGGDVNINGGHGWHGMRAMMGVAAQASPGVGGVSHLTNVNSFGFQVIGSTASGIAGAFPGGGGSGGANGASQASPSAGSLGGDGCIILKEYF
jgi:hypothetical protein